MIETYMFFQISHLFPVFEKNDFTYWVKQDVGVFSNLLSRRIKKNLKSFQSLSVCFLYYSRPEGFEMHIRELGDSIAGAEGTFRALGGPSGVFVDYSVCSGLLER